MHGSNTANPHEDTIGAQLIDVAREMGGITFVYHSVLHSLLSEMPHHMRKREVERALVDAGVPYVILQPAPFMQMLAPAIGSVKAGGPLVQKFFSTDSTRMSFVDMDDYSEAAAEAIASEKYLYGTYELCGDGAYSLPDLERIVSELAGARRTQRLYQRLRLPEERAPRTRQLPGADTPHDVPPLQHERLQGELVHSFSHPGARAKDAAGVSGRSFQRRIAWQTLII